MTLFLADLQVPEVDIPPIPKLGRNAVASCEVSFDDLFVADADVVGEAGRGFHHLLDGLNPERILLAAEALGIGRAAIRRAVAYANERVVFGRPIGQNQGIAFPLADAHMRLRAAELMIREASARYDAGLPCGEQANSAKYLAAEAACDAADRAVQTHGGMGYATEYDVERYWREARLDPHRPDLPGDGPQLRRRARPRPAPLVLTRSSTGIPGRRVPSRYVPATQWTRFGPGVTCPATHPAVRWASIHPVEPSPMPAASDRGRTRSSAPSVATSTRGSGPTSRACGPSPSSPSSSSTPGCSACTAGSSASTCSSSSPGSSSPA